ncbi:MAG TPA: hypothetical protein DCE41_13620 [Cytophagales bacterium]|nr:hypothetical protein [Cytophagales bacterium]HAA17719.1 hypothetical protein [Cytophagales bacterium]HAP60015.1 hypothetical protein [Cytophagales bacterium]
MENIALVSYNDIPSPNPTYKYDRLGEMSLCRNLHYCQRHGYTYLTGLNADPDSHPCWQKIPAILAALEQHDWVCWVDSDVLIEDMSIPLSRFTDAKFDLITQCPETFLRFLSWPRDLCYQNMPLNTGVFLIKSTDWSRQVLREAYSFRRGIPEGGIWDGIGEQEAILEVIRKQPDGLTHLGYHPQLQAHPKHGQPGVLGLHFYGNYAEHRIPEVESLAILKRWEDKVLAGGELPADKARFHYACIQYRESQPEINRKNPEFFLYSEEEITAGTRFTQTSCLLH